MDAENQKEQGRDYSFVIKEAIIEGIDHAVNGHRGLLDGPDMDRMRKERMEYDAQQEQINTLFTQTNEIKKQTEYILYALVATVIASAVSIVAIVVGIFS